MKKIFRNINVVAQGLSVYLKKIKNNEKNKSYCIWQIDPGHHVHM